MEIQNIKKNWKEIVEGTVTMRDEGMNVFDKYWAEKVKKRTQRELFNTKDIKKVIIQVLEKFRDIERRFSLKVENPTPAGRSGNILLTGVKGVGKTLLMTALNGFASDICAGFVSIYISYEDNNIGANKSSIFELYKQLRGFDDIPSDVQGLADWCVNNSKTVVLFADEVQELYRSTKHLNIIREILVVGKCEASFGIISGSIQCVRSLVHKETIYTGPEYFNTECVNLNHQVYKELRVLPLRQKTEINSFKIQHNVDTDDNELFKKTGGVGGNLVNFTDELSIVHILKEMEDPQKRTIIHKLYAKNLDIKADNVWKQQKVSTSDFPQISHAFSNLLLLCDLGILFTTDTVNYEFLIPEHIFLLQYYMKDNPKKYLLFAFEGTWRGWGGQSSPGTVLEFELRKRLVGEYFPFLVCEYSDKCLSFSKSPKKDCIKLSNAGIDYLLNKMLHSCADNGSDGFMLKRDVDDAKTIFIHHLQIKTGKEGKKITRGGQRSQDDDTTIVGISHKFVRSFDTISKQLCERFPSLKFKATSFTLLTTKGINSDAKSLIENGIPISGESVQFLTLEKDVVSELLKEELSILGIDLS